MSAGNVVSLAERSQAWRVPDRKVEANNWRLDTILERLERPRRAGKGYSARCPAHEDRNASLSVSETANGLVLIHCFAGCDTLDVLAAIGLTMTALFPERICPTTPEERREAQRYARESRWAAALGVIAFEACIVLAAATKCRAGELLDDEEVDRLQKAGQLIHQAREVLRGR